MSKTKESKQQIQDQQHMKIIEQDKESKQNKNQLVNEESDNQENCQSKVEESSEWTDCDRGSEKEIFVNIKRRYLKRTQPNFQEQKNKLKKLKNNFKKGQSNENSQINLSDFSQKSEELTSQYESSSNISQEKKEIKLSDSEQNLYNDDIKIKNNKSNKVISNSSYKYEVSGNINQQYYQQKYESRYYELNNKLDDILNYVERLQKIEYNVYQCKQILHENDIKFDQMNYQQERLIQTIKNNTEYLQKIRKDVQDISYTIDNKCKCRCDETDEKLNHILNQLQKFDQIQEQKKSLIDQNQSIFPDIFKVIIIAFTFLLSIIVMKAIKDRTQSNQK